jgi:hypothetical protein
LAEDREKMEILRNYAWKGRNWRWSKGKVSQLSYLCAIMENDMAMSTVQFKCQLIYIVAPTLCQQKRQGYKQKQRLLKMLESRQTQKLLQKPDERES